MSATVKPIVMESGKFLSTINNSAQAKVAQFESYVKKLGQKAGAEWRLAALTNDKLFIEDGEGRYYQAKHSRAKGGKVSITNVIPIKIVEEKKQQLFEQNCFNLVTSIEKNDQRGMRGSFNSLAAQRFSKNTIPSDGMVRTRDGVVRKMVVESDITLTQDQRQKLIGALVESVSDSITLDNGRVISAVFGEDSYRRIPISEWACRKVVGRYMRETAKDAYLSTGFQARMYKLASFINEDKIKEAVKEVSKFLKESQEFALLTRGEMQTLVENSLAASAVLNQQLCDDVATLIYRTNLRVNRDDIIKEWMQTAKKAQHPTLLENVNILAKSKNFEGSYDKFINLAFNEAMSPRDEEVDAYRTALSLLRSSPKLLEDQELKTKVDDLIGRLSNKEVDDATVHLVRETLAAAKKEVDSLGSLQDYDEMPGDNMEPGIDGGGDEAEGLGGEIGDAMGAGAAGGQPTIVINAPLISIGGEPAGGEMGGLDDLGGEDEMAGLDDLEGGGDEMGMGGGDEMGMGGEEEEDELGMMGMGDEEEEEEDEDDIDLNLDLSSRRRRGKTVSERAANKALGLDEDSDWFKKNVLNKGDDSDDNDGNDSDDDSGNTATDDAATDDDSADDSGNPFAESKDDCCTKCKCDPCECSDDSDDDSGKPWTESKDDCCTKCKCDPCECDDDDDSGKPWEESRDPYSYGKKVDFQTGLGGDYGSMVIESSTMGDVVTTMFNLIEDKGFNGTQALSQIERIASEAVNEHGIRMPKHKVNPTIDQVVEAFCRRAVHTEDQHNWSTLMRRRGFRKSNYARDEHEKGADVGSGSKGGGGDGGDGGEGGVGTGTGSSGFSGSAPGEVSKGFGEGGAPNNEKAGISGSHGSGQPDNETDGWEGSEPKSPEATNESVMRESIVWLEHDKERYGVLGDFSGIRFILDYASPPAILSEDGSSVQVPIPESVVSSALASANLQQGNSILFTNWLGKNIEQFRPVSEHEDQELAEAVATITAHGDGTIEVAVDGDVGVGELDGMGGEGEVDPLTGEPVAGGEMGEVDPETGMPIDGGEVDPMAGGEVDGLDDTGEMQPVGDPGVDDVGAVGADDLPGGDIPDFEGGVGAATDGPVPPPAGGAEGGPPVPGDETEEEAVVDPTAVKPAVPGPEEEEVPVAEDRDMTDPTKGKYDTTGQDHREHPKEGGKAPKPKNSKNMDGFDEKVKQDDTADENTKLEKVKPGSNRP